MPDYISAYTGAEIDAAISLASSLADGTEPTWWDGEAALAALPDSRKVFVLLTDTSVSTVIPMTANYNRALTSDGKTYTGTSAVTHTWDTMLDKPCIMDGQTVYSTRYYILICSDVAAQPIAMTFNSNDILYVIVDGVVISAGANLSSRRSLRGMKYLNGGNLRATSFANNSSMRAIPDDTDLTGSGNITGMFNACFGLLWAKFGAAGSNTMTTWFQNNYSLLGLEIDMQGVGEATSMLNNALALVHFKPSNVNCDLNLTVNTQLDKQSLMATIAALSDRAGQASATLTLGNVHRAKLSPADEAVATSKNWVIN